MLKKILCGCVIISFFSCGSLKESRRDYSFTPLDTVINSWIQKEYYPGASIMVVKDDKVLFEKYYGNYTPETEVYIASAGKWLAAAAIAAVVDKTPLTWNDNVETWLPEFKGNVKGKITLRQLLSHTSGIPDYHVMPKRDTYNSLTQSVADILPLDTVFAPGSRFQYGGLAMQVAGRMAEVASGMDFETLFQIYICQPLGMVNTHFIPVDTGNGHSPMLGGGARTNMHDYMKFLKMISHDGNYNGKEVLSKESIKEMQADQVKKAKVLPGEYVERALGRYHTGIYGLGEWREKVNEYGEAYQISSPGWAGPYPWLNKKENVYGFFLTHVQGFNMQRDGVSSFYGSPIISALTSAIVSKPKIEKGVADIGDALLYYEVAGAGEPMILLHAHSVDRRMWNKQFSELSKHYKVYRYDLRGYGLSSSPVEGKAFLHANDLDLFMEKLGIQKAHLVGLSLGALTIADFMFLHPEKVLSATLAAGGLSDADYINPLTPLLREKKQQAVNRVKNQGIPAYKEWWLNEMKKISAPAFDSTPLAMLIDEWKAWQPLHIESSVFLGQSALPAYKAGRISVPTLFIIGRYDSQGSQSSSLKLSHFIFGSKVAYIEDAGHFSNLERPAEFTKLVFDFVSSFKMK